VNRPAAEHARLGHTGGEPPADSPERDAIRQLAEELRELASALHDRAVPVDVSLAASAALRSINGEVRSAPLRDYTSEQYRSTGFVDFSPVAGLANPVAPPLAMSLEPDGRVVASAVFGVAFEGPPGHVHGGVLAAAFDEVLGLAQVSGGKPGMTGRLTIHYRRPTPLGVEVRFEGWVDSVSGRKISVKAVSKVLVGDAWVVSAESDGLFISLPDGFGHLVGKGQ
jgi:acyl-coenzyme A thioesterase PaaI-like protein